MTTLAPTDVAAQWLDSVLTGDAELAALAPGGIFGRGNTLQSIRRQMPAWPAVVWGYQGTGSTEEYSQDGLALGRYRFQVEAIDKSADQGAAVAVAALLHSLIADPRGSDPSGQVMRCYRLRPIDRQETADGGAQFQHVGGLYEIWVKGA